MQQPQQPPRPPVPAEPQPIPEQGQRENNSRCQRVTGIVILILLIILLCSAVVIFTPHLIKQMRPFFDWIADHPLQGYLIYFAVYVLSIPLLVPALLFVLAASLSFTQALGFSTAVLITIPLSYIGALLGCIAAFLLGRLCCQNCARQCLIERYKVIRALDSIFVSHGIKLVALIRLSAIVPFSGSNYVLGMTRVSLKDYIIGSLFMLPNTAIIVVIGCSFEDLATIFSGQYKGSGLYAFLIVFSVLVAIALLIIIIIYTRREFRRLTEQERRARQEQEEEEVLLNDSPPPSQTS